MPQSLLEQLKGWVVACSPSSAAPGAGHEGRAWDVRDRGTHEGEGRFRTGGTCSETVVPRLAWSERAPAHRSLQLLGDDAADPETPTMGGSPSAFLRKTRDGEQGGDHPRFRSTCASRGSADLPRSPARDAAFCRWAATSGARCELRGAGTRPPRRWSSAITADAAGRSRCSSRAPGRFSNVARGPVRRRRRLGGDTGRSQHAAVLSADAQRLWSGAR